MILGTMLNCVHIKGKEEEGSWHEQQRLMRLQTSLIGRSGWSSPFQVLSPIGRDGLVDNGSYFHMIGGRDFFDSLT
jgi:hypothetical protein